MFSTSYSARTVWRHVYPLFVW